MAHLKWLVVRDLQLIESATFWKDGPEIATGELRTYWSTKKPLRDATGQIIGMIGISHDITEKKRLEDKLRRQKELLDALVDNVDALIHQTEMPIALLGMSFLNRMEMLRDGSTMTLKKRF